MATIRKKRPELFEDIPLAAPIPSEPPGNYFFGMKWEKRGKGEKRGGVR